LTCVNSACAVPCCNVRSLRFFPLVSRVMSTVLLGNPSSWPRWVFASSAGLLWALLLG
jgi:hypothetical protein